MWPAPRCMLQGHWIAKMSEASYGTSFEKACGLAALEALPFAGNFWHGPPSCAIESKKGLGCFLPGMSGTCVS